VTLGKSLNLSELSPLTSEWKQTPRSKGSWMCFGSSEMTEDACSAHVSLRNSVSLPSVLKLWTAQEGP
jgi:hypothetical protein